MITLKVGMRVKGDGVHDGISVSGNTGKIISIDGDPDDEWTMYSVRWDKENPNFHDCGGRCDRGHGWNVDRSHLTPINDEQFIVEWEEVKK